LVTKSKKEDAGRKKIKVLKLNKETIKNLTTDQAKEIKGATICPSSPTGNCQIPSCTYGCTLPIKTGK